MSQNFINSLNQVSRSFPKHILELISLIIGIFFNSLVNIEAQIIEFIVRDAYARNLFGLSFASPKIEASKIADRL